MPLVFKHILILILGFNQHVHANSLRWIHASYILKENWQGDDRAGVRRAKRTAKLGKA
jgi:hypothetical protein